MAEKSIPTPEELRQLLRHEPETGKLFWRHRCETWFVGRTKRPAKWAAANWNSRRADKEAFIGKHNKGYFCGRVCGADLLAHRVGWAIHYGSWPANEVDHINGIRTDNRIENLRSVDTKQNARNKAMPLSNRSGTVGVSKMSGCNRWRARIYGPDGELHLGLFETLSEAVAARKEAGLRFGYHNNHGRT